MIRRVSLVAALLFTSACSGSTVFTDDVVPISRGNGEFPFQESGARVELPQPVGFEMENGLRVRLLASSDVPLVTFSVRIEGGGREDATGREGAWNFGARCPPSPMRRRIQLTSALFSAWPMVRAPASRATSRTSRNSSSESAIP